MQESIAAAMEQDFKKVQELVDEALHAMSSHPSAASVGCPSTSQPLPDLLVDAEKPTSVTRFTRDIESASPQIYQLLIHHDLSLQ